MKIIELKNNQLPETENYTKSCPKCGTRFEFTKDDFLNCDTHILVKCPNPKCKSTVFCG